MVLPAGRLGFGAGDRDEGQADVTESSEQTVQRGLVHNVAAKDREDAGTGWIGARGEGEAVEPRRPPLVEATLKADLVAGWLVLAVVGVHGPLLSPVLPDSADRLGTVPAG
jgi:hypothetical protein